MKKLNGKSKGEQLFVLMLMFVALVGMLCVTGCGRKACETPQCGNEESGGVKVVGCSIPGIGGCLSSGKGCDTACWPQSHKISCLSGEGIDVKACDTRYYGDGCLGCGQVQKSCYVGCGSINLKNKEENEEEYEEGYEEEYEEEYYEGINAKGIFWGSSDGKEYVIGCKNGCGGCFGTGHELQSIMYDTEFIGGIN